MASYSRNPAFVPCFSKLTRAHDTRWSSTRGALTELGQAAPKMAVVSDGGHPKLHRIAASKTHIADAQRKRHSLGSCESAFIEVEDGWRLHLNQRKLGVLGIEEVIGCAWHDDRRHFEDRTRLRFHPPIP